MRLSACFGRPRRAGHDRPIDQRIERKFVVGDVEADRIAGFERGALRQEQRQPGKAGFADGVDVGVAGDDIGELGFERRRRHVGGLRDCCCARAARCVSASSGNADQRPLPRRAEARGMSRAMPPPRNSTTSVSSRNSASAREEDRSAQIQRLAGAVDLRGARCERREIERRQAVGGGERVDGEEALRRTIEAGRMIGGGARRKSRSGTGRAVGGGAMKVPKPSSTRLGGTASCTAPGLCACCFGDVAWCRRARRCA